MCGFRCKKASAIGTRNVGGWPHEKKAQFTKRLLLDSEQSNGTAAGLLSGYSQVSANQWRISGLACLQPSIAATAGR